MLLLVGVLLRVRNSIGVSSRLSVIVMMVCVVCCVVIVLVRKLLVMFVRL